jgi:hypothetical protein
MNSAEDQEPVEECLWHLQMEVADQQADLDRLLAVVQHLEAQMPLPLQQQTQITFLKPPTGTERIIWEAAALPEEFAEDQLGDMLRLLEAYVIAAPICVPDGKWLAFLYSLFEYSLAKIDS